MNKDNLKFWIPNSAILEANCTNLVGKKITVISRDGTSDAGIIAGADPYIGLSVVKEVDRTAPLYCYHGPFDPNYREIYLSNDIAKEQYNNDFLIVLDHFRVATFTGVLDIALMLATLRIGVSGGRVVCPFGV